MNWRTVFSPACIAALLTMGAAAAGMKTAMAAMHVVLYKKPIYAVDHRAVRAIPTETDHWIRVGDDQQESAAVVEELGTENYVTRVYLEKLPKDSTARPRDLQLHSAYYTGTIDTVPHVPDRCFVGAGWSIVGLPQDIVIPLDTSGWVAAEGLPPKLEGRVYTTRLSQDFSTFGRGRRINLPVGLTPTSPLRFRVTEFMKPGGGRRFEGYFFLANGTAVPSAEEVRTAAFDLTSTYAYYMKIQVGSSNVTSAQELATGAGALLNDLLGELMTCAPDWVRVERGEWPPKEEAEAKPEGESVRR